MTVAAVREDYAYDLTLDAGFGQAQRVWQLWADPRQLERAWSGWPTAARHRRRRRLTPEDSRVGVAVAIQP